MRKLSYIIGLIIGVSTFSMAYGQSCKGVSAGGFHTCILTSGGNVDCYGDNFAGRAEDYTKGDAVGVSAGLSHTCVLTSDGNVECYGDNFAGRAEDYTKGDAVGVSAGWNHTCVLTSDGNVDCYGDNFAGRAEDYTGGDALCSVSPVPDIKANGSDVPVAISFGDSFTLTGQLNVGSMSGQDADWWVGVNMASSPPDDWYHYDLTSGWMPGKTPTYQGPLFDLNPYDVLGMPGLPVGAYTFYLAVDMDMNGLLDLDQIYYDSVQVTIEP